MSKTLPKLHRFIVLVSAVLGTLMLFLTGTRGPILSFALGIIIMYLIPERIGHANNKFTTATIIIIVCIVGGLIFFFNGDINDTLYRTTYMVRINGIQWAISMFLSSPILGIGLNNYLFVLPDFVGTAAMSVLKFGRTVHDQYALFLVETGLLGFISFLLFLISLFRTCWMAIITQSKSVTLAWLPLGFLGSLVAFSTACLSDVPFLKPPVQIYLAILTAAVCLLAYGNGRPKLTNIDNSAIITPANNE